MRSDLRAELNKQRIRVKNTERRDEELAKASESGLTEDDMLENSQTTQKRIRDLRIREQRGSYAEPSGQALQAPTTTDNRDASEMPSGKEASKGVSMSKDYRQEEETDDVKSEAADVSEREEA